MTARPSARARAWNRAMAASPGDLDVDVPASAIDGEVPSRLRGGRLLSNGPGWTKIGDRLAHPFDGHGYLRSFELTADGGLRLRARFVRTPTYLAESTAGRLVHKGFATNIDDRFWKNVGSTETRNVANTTVVPWRGQLLAGWEGGSPYALDPDSLETRGEHTFGGLIEGQATLAHMHFDAVHNRLVLCSVAQGRTTGFTFREVDENDDVVSSARATFDSMLFTHDFALTPNHYVLGGNPLRVKPVAAAKMMIGAGTLLNAVTPDVSQPGALHLIERGSGKTRSVRLPGPAFVVHFGNAFERDGDVVVDACVFARFEMGEEFGYTGPKGGFDPALPERRGPQRLLRITVPQGGDDATWEPLTEHGVDFPRFHPQHEGVATPLMFGATRRDTRFSDPFDSVIRVDLLDRDRPASLWSAPENVFAGEPIFVPAVDDESAGHVLALLSDGLGEQTTLVILDAADLEKGPVASVPLPLLPVAFHGDWLSPRAR